MGRSYRACLTLYDIHVGAAHGRDSIPENIPLHGTVEVEHHDVLKVGIIFKHLDGVRTFFLDSLHASVQRVESPV